jgi:hypothetical protein
MRKMSLFSTCATAVFAIVFVAVGVFAGALGPEVVRMESDAYKTHERGIVEFNHNKHVVDYKLSCGACHHNEDGEPLASFKMGDKAPSCINCHDLEETHNSHSEQGCGECHMDEQGNPMEVMEIKKCIECHDTPGLAARGMTAPKLSKDERLKYHGEAVHYSCRGCHRKYNQENNTKAAPLACNGCHPKTGGEHGDKAAAEETDEAAAEETGEAEEAHEAEETGHK